MSGMLKIGDSFPEINVDIVSGGQLRIPAGLKTKYKVVLFYRGHW